MYTLMHDWSPRVQSAVISVEIMPVTSSPDGRVVNAGLAKSSKKGKKVAGKNEESDIFKIVKMVMERHFDPVLPHPLPSPPSGHAHIHLPHSRVRCRG